MASDDYETFVAGDGERAIRPVPDHDGHTVNVGPVTVGIDTEAVRYSFHNGPAYYDRSLELCDEVDRLRAENAALAAALDDIAGMRLAPSGLWLADAECASENKRCHHRYPDDPGEWCPVCVAEVAWSAWKMGALG